jgi:transposase
VEKGGLAAALHAVGLTRISRVGVPDELRLGLRGTTRRGWGRRGVKVRQRLQLKYDWWYLFAAVDGQAGTVWWTWVDSMRATDLVPLMAALRLNTPLDALVWDGAPSHRDEAVRAVGVPLVGLPPYSPELNPAERLFEEVRRHVEGRVYATLADKVAAVNAFLAELDADPARVRSLCGWAWINATIATLPAPLENAA